MEDTREHRKSSLILNIYSGVVAIAKWFVASLVPRLFVVREEKSLVSTVHTCAQLSSAEHVFRQ